MKLAAAARRVVMVRAGEGAALAWAGLYFFFLLFGYYLLRPVRETMGIERGADRLPWLMTGTMAVMLLANPLFSWLVSRLPRRRFIPWVYRFFALNLALFFAVHWWAPEGWRVGVGYAFYVWLSVFNLFAVSVFWAVMADVFTTEQGTRLFAVIGVGGTLGGIAGASAAGLLIGTIGAPGLLLVAGLLLESAVRCAGRLMDAGGLGGTRPRTPEPEGGVLSGIGAVGRSPYLLLVCAHLFLYALLSTFLYLEQGRIVEGAIVDRAERTRLFASIDLWVNVLTLVVQALAAGRIMAWAGVGPALAAIPMLSALGFAALWAGPRLGVEALTVLVVFQVSRRGLNYAISQPGRQVLFTAVSQEEKYKSKAFIDTFVYRAGDLAGAWTPAAIVGMAARAGIAASAAVPLVAAPLGLLGMGVGLGLGRMLRRRSAARVAAPAVAGTPALAGVTAPPA